jgi:NADP-dependent 3-hydroxy acid dehydrogenase YdfG
MLLGNKNAILYGGGGAIGGAVARTFAGEGAKVFLAGRPLATLDAAARDIAAAGGAAETAQVDALDKPSVQKSIAAVTGAAVSSIPINRIFWNDGMLAATMHCACTAKSNRMAIVEAMSHLFVLSAQESCAK